MPSSLRAPCRTPLTSVAILFSAAAVLAAGCATGTGTNRDGGTRRDTPAPGVDAPATDAPIPPGTDAPVTPGTDAPMPAVDAPPTIVRDSGAPFDGGPGFDAGPPPECTTAADCGDGNACNGIERCEFGMCNPGVAVTCDDGVACTTDSCSGGACVYTPSDAACGTGMTCTSTGCMTTGMCTETPCRLVPPQCGCPAGQACYLAGTARACFTSGATPEGGGCANVNDCAAGMLCVNFSAGTPAQMCSRMCAADTDCAGGGLCIGQLSDGMGGARTDVRLCTRSCDPIGQSGCVAGLECTLFREAAGAMRLYRDCNESLGTRTARTSATAPYTLSMCTNEDDCAPGHACVNLYGMGPECARWCNATTGGGCAGTENCYGFMTPLVVSGIEYGVCGF